ncbi:MAG: DUF4168 domain-containing protein [Phenylobacterium sp.]|uniref:DUF4168 domain-containing protein n=1 Tax=Phenylobacterium sp. TaxID=1871053 RepID=UPI00273479FF|nr:DUF4168 domain-containing protein [Phenylobacterium sp.]MDP1643452.1 DUF4168 domain-containing protein [Phenylobacterium sp.]MDP3117557.1 DUF4168 domain-containing protein [Phenylobacterium sp.]MDZ4053592.1 DUF4168 domain-containing protein [Phenylobacterium sp.]
MRMTLTTLAASAAVFALGATAAQAQQTAPAPAPQQQAAPQAAGEITDEKVNSFALAMNQVSSLNQKYGAEIQAAPEGPARTEVQQKAAAEMSQAVEQAGLTPQEYNQIAQAAQNDAELRARIGQAMQANGVAPAAN